MPKGNGVTRIVLVDDHSLFRAGLKALLARQDNLSVVAEAATATEGCRVVDRYRCDLVLVDYHLPDQDGLWLVDRLRRSHPSLPILVLSQFTELEKVRRIMERGCHGYLVKSASEEELLAAVKVVAAGGVYFHPAVAQAFLQPADTSYKLNARELTIAQLLTNGLGNQQIAQSLNLSLGTIKRELSQLYNRFSVSDRTQLVAELLARRLVEPPRAP